MTTTPASTGIVQTDPIPTDVLAEALTSLGNHARAMDNAEEEHHDECVYCESLVLLARLVGFGEQLRRYERRTAKP